MLIFKIISNFKNVKTIHFIQVKYSRSLFLRYTTVIFLIAQFQSVSENSDIESMLESMSDSGVNSSLQFSKTESSFVDGNLYFI